MFKYLVTDANGNVYNRFNSFKDAMNYRFELLNRNALAFEKGYCIKRKFFLFA